MFLLITFLFISLFNLNRLERNTNNKSNKNLLNLLLPENPLVTNEGVSSSVTEKKNTSLFIITFHCFTVRVSNQLAFTVRRAATGPFTSVDLTLSLTIMVSKIYLMMRIKGDVFFSKI